MGKHTTWADTKWGDPETPRKLTRKERAAQMARDREDYKIGKTSIAIGGATLNEEALRAEAIRVAFSRDSTGDVRGIEAGIEAIEKLCADLPIDLSEIEASLSSAFEDGIDDLQERKKRDQKLGRIDLWDVGERLIRRAAEACQRDYYHSRFPFPRHTSRGSLIARGTKRGGASELTLTGDNGQGDTQILWVSPAYLSMRREINVHRYGDGTLIVGWADWPGEPGAVYVLRTSVAFTKRLVIATDARKSNRLDARPSMRVLKNVPFSKEV